MSSQPSRTFPYHRDYGLTDEVRLAAIETARVTSPRVAADHHNVGLSTIYKWMRAANPDSQHQGETP
jgi:transposase